MKMKTRLFDFQGRAVMPSGVLVTRFYLYSLFAISLLLNVKAVSENDNQYKLRHLHLLFRHGDRSPISVYEKIISNYLDIWPEGLGQLTNIGIRQQFELGRWLRSQYGNFAPSIYNRSFYYIRSTDFDRTLMSAMSNAAGFFNYSLSPLETYGVNWSPIPVHTISKEYDVLFSLAKCPKLEMLWEKQSNSEEARKYDKSHEEISKMLKNIIGSEFHMSKVADLLICMKAHSVPLPSWCTPSVWSEIMEVNRVQWVRTFAIQAEIIQLEIGTFLHEFVDHIETLITTGQSKNKDLSTEHMMVYSAHDTDVVYLLAGLGVYDNELISYASIVILELLGPKPPAPKVEYRLRVRYKKGWSDTEASYLQLPVCVNETAANGCPWNRVVSQLQALMLAPESYKEACQIHESVPSNHKLVVAFVVIICLIVIPASLYIVIHYWRRRTHRVMFTNSFST